MENLQVLFLEDNPLDARRILGLLGRPGSGDLALDHVETLEAALDRLTKRSYDVILTDLHVPDSDGLETYFKLAERAPQTPIVILTGTCADESMAIEAVQKGAQDYLTKQDLSAPALRRAIRYAVERKQLENLRRGFLSMVTHELNTPISVIAGGADNLSAGILGPLNDKQAKYVEMIAQSAQRLLRLTNDIHDLTKLQSGHFNLNFEKTDLRKLTESTCDALKEMAAAKNVKLRVSTAVSTPAVVRADPQRIEQVITNVTKNALRFADAAVDVKLNDAGGEYQIVVEDDGPGLDPNDIPQLFSAFYQGKQKTASDGGSGLGLAIVKGIVESHGGRVEAANRVDTGARFTVTFRKWEAI